VDLRLLESQVTLTEFEEQVDIYMCTFVSARFCVCLCMCSRYLYVVCMCTYTSTHESMCTFVSARFCVCLCMCSLDITEFEHVDIYVVCVYLLNVYIYIPSGYIYYVDLFEL